MSGFSLYFIHKVNKLMKSSLLRQVLRKMKKDDYQMKVSMDYRVSSRST